MRHTRQNIFYHELIGLKIRVLDYPDPSLRGLEGRVLDETKYTLLIETGRGRRVRILKLHGVFQFMLPNGEKVIIRGAKILARPEERLKKIRRR